MTLKSVADEVQRCGLILDANSEMDNYTHYIELITDSHTRQESIHHPRILPPPRQHLLHKLPEGLGVVAVLEVGQFVDDSVFQGLSRQAEEVQDTITACECLDCIRSHHSVLFSSFHQSVVSLVIWRYETPSLPKCLRAQRIFRPSLEC